MTEIVETERGPGRLAYFLAQEPQGMLLLSHGAGKGIESADLQVLAARLPPEGWSVALFEQPWRVAGRKVATPPPTLDVALKAAAVAVRTNLRAGMDLPLILGGRSAGARSALRCAAELGAVGALGLAFPLHPPGRPDRSRLSELLNAEVPVLLLQGERDSMGKPEEFPTSLPLRARVVGVPSADHSLRVPKRGEFNQQAAFELIVNSTLEFACGLIST